MTARSIKIFVAAALALGMIVLAVGTAAARPVRKAKTVKTAQPARAVTVIPTVRPETGTEVRTEVCESQGWKEFVANYRPAQSERPAVRPATAAPSSAKKATTRR